MILLLVVAAVLFGLAAAGLVLGVRQGRRDAARAAFEEPARLTQNLAGQDLSWNDLVVNRLRAHYGDTNHNLGINDLLRKWQQDNP
jgi:hypothetical protein